MHILYVHKNFPAQFGHIAASLLTKLGFQCTFVSELPPGNVQGIERIQYKIKGMATANNHYCSRTFENAVWHSHAVYEALKARPDIVPDLVVGHSGFLSTLYLRELYNCPTVNYFEFYYYAHGYDLDYRPEDNPPELKFLRARTRNANLLLDLDNCDAGYSPTLFQRNLLPENYHSKVRVLFDGLDTNLWKPSPVKHRQIGDRTIPDSMRIITYVSRGLESMRGFDIFMKVAKKIYQARDDVVFVVVGSEKCFYGSDEEITGGKMSLKNWLLTKEEYDLSRFLFIEYLKPPDLAQLFSMSDLHIYLTVPFVLSWSMLDALACGAVVLGSATPPVQEVIEEGKNGLLAGFFDVDGMADKALKVMENPSDYKELGKAGLEMIKEKYSLEVCLPQHMQFYEKVVNNFKK